MIHLLQINDPVKDLAQLNAWLRAVTDAINSLTPRAGGKAVATAPAHTIPLATLGTSEGSLTWNSDGLITKFVDPT